MNPRCLRWAVAVILTTLMLAPVRAGADSAIAIAQTCQGTRPFGWAAGQTSYDEAEQLALAKCNRADCKLVRAIANKCMALAYDRATTCGAYGLGHETTVEQSVAAALAECAGNGGRGCQVVAKFCDTTYQASPRQYNFNGNGQPTVRYKLNPPSTPPQQPQPCMNETCGRP